MRITTHDHFKDLPEKTQSFILKYLTMGPKRGCLYGDLLKHNPPVAMAYNGTEHPIGVATILDPHPSEKVKMHTLEVYVRRNHRRRGVGRKLVAALNKFATLERVIWFGGDKFFERILFDIQPNEEASLDSGALALDITIK